jgi:hypothetical protein
MSIELMVQLVRARDRREQPERDTLASPSLGKDQQPAPVTTALQRLTAFIPSEIVTGWGAAMGLIAPKTLIATWAIFGGAGVCLVILTLLETALQDETAATRTSRAKKVLMVLFATVSFTVWAFSLPGSPAAAQWGDGATRYFGISAIVLAAVLIKVTQLGGLAPLEGEP